MTTRYVLSILKKINDLNVSKNTSCLAIQKEFDIARGGKKGGEAEGGEKGQDAARCAFSATTNEGKDDWSNSLSVAPIRSHVTRFINPFSG